MSREFLWGSSLLVTLFVGASAALAVERQDIRPEPGGKRLLFVDEKDIRLEPGGKRVLYIDDNYIRTEPGGKALLYVDGDDIRPDRGDIRLAFIDKYGNFRRNPNSDNVLIHYKHPDLSPTHIDNRIFFVDGPELTRQQLVAVLYYLKPEIFKLSDAEIASLRKAMADEAKAEEVAAAADHVAGKWMVLSGSGPVAKIGGGGMTIGPKKGDAYPVVIDHSKTGGPQWTGVGVYKEMSGDKSMWVAYGTPKTIGLCVYEIKDGSLDGKWYPWYVDGDAKNVGTETLTGPATLDGEYKIAAGKAPFTGAAYSGTVTIKPAKIVGAADTAKPYLLSWTMGAVKVSGIGIRSGKYLFVAAGAGRTLILSDMTTTMVR